MSKDMDPVEEGTVGRAARPGGPKRRAVAAKRPAAGATGLPRREGSAPAAPALSAAPAPSAAAAPPFAAPAPAEGGPGSQVRTKLQLMEQVRACKKEPEGQVQPAPASAPPAPPRASTSRFDPRAFIHRAKESQAEDLRRAAGATASVPAEPPAPAPSPVIADNVRGQARIPLTTEQGLVNFAGVFRGRAPGGISKPAKDRAKMLRATDPVAASDALELATLCDSCAILNQKSLSAAPWKELKKAWGDINNSPQADYMFSSFPLESMMTLNTRSVKEHLTAGTEVQVRTAANLTYPGTSACRNRRGDNGLVFNLEYPQASAALIEFLNSERMQHYPQEEFEAFGELFKTAVVDNMVGGRFYTWVAGAGENESCKVPGRGTFFVSV